ncbi:MAG: hypothetical protein H6509_10750 [Bryobacterales bacterium]|nr:hypothetical protein [Bryobacterales bacterium]
MKLENIFDTKHALSRRGFAGLLLLPAAAAAAARNDDYRRGGGNRGGAGGYGRIWRAAPSDNFDPRRPDGRFDLRAFVDGAAEFEIRGDQVAWRAFRGGAPRDAGCEFRKPVPRAELYGLRLDQRDGRSRIEIVDTPSPRNDWALVLRILDHKGGDDRYHARITWESDSSFGRGRGGYDGYGAFGNGRDRGPYDRGPYDR